MMLALAASAALLCAPYFDARAEAYGYRDCDGAIRVPATLIAASPFNDCGVATVMDKHGVRLINREGAVLLHPMVFDNGADPFREGLARYVEGGRYGYFDNCGVVVIPAQFDFALPFDGGRARGGYDCTFPPVPPSGEYRRYQCQRWVELEHPLKKGQP